MKTEKAKKTLSVALPCCGRTVAVTGRRSKQRERPRHHRCPDCCKQYTVDASGGVPVVRPTAVGV